MLPTPRSGFSWTATPSPPPPPGAPGQRLCRGTRTHRGFATATRKPCSRADGPLWLFLLHISLGFSGRALLTRRTFARPINSGFVRLYSSSPVQERRRPRGAAGFGAARDWAVPNPLGRPGIAGLAPWIEGSGRGLRARRGRRGCSTGLPTLRSARKPGGFPCGRPGMVGGARPSGSLQRPRPT
nr:collagen alpha-1(I) chain-like [Symphalangus syndactylus]